MKEFVDFLATQPPYDRLDEDDLQRLATAVVVEYFRAGTVIVEADSAPLERLYLIRVGSVEVVDRGRVTDLLGVGDTFGHISVLSGLSPPLQIRAVEDTLCYLLPDPYTVLTHPQRLQFTHYGSLVARQRLIAGGGSLRQLDRQLGTVTRSVTWCEATDSIRSVAASMTASGSSCALYRAGSQFGIVTDYDFRRRVATGEVSVDAPVSTIASVPAISMSADATIATAFLFMIERGIHHLVVADPLGLPIGIVRVVDMAAADVRNPLLVCGVIAAAATMDELVEASHLLTPTVVELWDAGLPVQHLGALLSTMIETVIGKVVALYTEYTLLADLQCCWMVLGSLGRREPLPNSDVDTALAWRFTGTDTTPPTREQTAAAAEPTIDALRRCGLMPCPQGLNASSPLFNRSAEEWRTAAEAWRADAANTDSALMATTVLDARPITRPALVQPLRSALVSGVGRADLGKALTRLALADHPPRGFVREFVVEHFGEQKGHLNIKKAGLRPVASLARALAQRTGDPSGSTIERLEGARRAGLLTADEADSLRGAFTLCYQLVFGTQIEALRHGHPVESAIDPAALDPLERRHLRAAFREISHIQARFRRSAFTFEDR